MHINISCSLKARARFLAGILGALTGLLMGLVSVQGTQPFFFSEARISHEHAIQGNEAATVLFLSPVAVSSTVPFRDASPVTITTTVSSNASFQQTFAASSRLSRTLRDRLRKDVRVR